MKVESCWLVGGLLFSQIMANNSTNGGVGDVAPCGDCRPWIFLINRVLYFLKINGNIMEKEERLLETLLQGEDESRTRSSPQEAMDKSFKVR